MTQFESPFVLCIDVGTSSVRALVFDARGRDVPDWGAHRSYHPRTTPDGGSEVDCSELSGYVDGCISQVLTQSRGTRIAAVIMDTFWHSFMGVDTSGRPTTPLFTWADTRPAAAAHELKRRLNEGEVHARTGCHLHASYFPAKLTWLSGAEPDAFHSTAYWLSFGEYFLWRLTGQRACSIAMASGTGLLNQNSRDWDMDLIAELPVDVSQLSPLIDTGERLDAAGRWSALRRAVWLPALPDGACSNIGSGCIAANRMAVNIGTSSALRVVWPASAVTALPYALWCYHVDRQRFLLGGALSEGGNLWAWLRDAFQLPSVGEEERQLAAMPPDSHGLTILPLIAGERSPGWADDARALFAGITLNTTPVDIMRASLEGVALRVGMVYEALQEMIPGEHEIVASGSAILSSPTWLQILADVLDRPVVVSGEREATARGGALLALEALDLLPLREATFQFEGRYEPDRAHHHVYQAATERQRDLYRRLFEND